jgi:hypothetical protein
MSAWTVDLQNIFFWLFLAGLFAGVAAGSSLRRLRGKSGRAGTLGALFSLSAFFAALLGGLLCAGVSGLSWKAAQWLTAAAGMLLGAGGTGFGRQAGVLLLLLLLLFGSAAAVTLDGLRPVPVGGELLEVRVLSVKEQGSTVECELSFAEGDFTVTGFSGAGLSARAIRYRRSEWFFLCRPETLYGRLALGPAGGGDELSCREMSSLRRHLLRAAVWAGFLQREEAEAVKRRPELLAAYSLVSAEQGIRWRKRLP